MLTSATMTTDQASARRWRLRRWRAAMACRALVMMLAVMIVTSGLFATGPTTGPSVSHAASGLPVNNQSAVTQMALSGIAALPSIPRHQLTNPAPDAKCAGCTAATMAMGLCCPGCTGTASGLPAAAPVLILPAPAPAAFRLARDQLCGRILPVEPAPPKFSL